MAINVELRQKVGTAFDDADSLIYVKSHVDIIDGLFETDGTPSSGIKASLLPVSTFGGMRLAGTISAASETTADIQTAIDAYVTANDGSSVGCYVRVTTASTLSVSADHTFQGDDTASDLVLEINDWVICIEEGAGNIRTFATINNQIGLASATQDGLMSATERNKLYGIDEDANDYSHPTQTAISVDGSGLEFIADVTVNTLGHVTAASKATIQSASTSQQGVVQLDDTAGSTSTTKAATARVVKLVADAVSTHEGYTNNPHSVTATQVGLGSVSNYGLATVTEAQTATSVVKYLTPSTVRNGLSAIASIPIFSTITTANTAAAISSGTEGYLSVGKLAFVEV